MTTTLRAWTSAIAIAAVLGLAAYISFVSTGRYVIGTIAGAPPILANLFANPFLVIHVIASIVALMLGPFQLLHWIRGRSLATHRLNGRIYLAATAVGSVSGLILAFGTTSGPVAATGFAMLALLWGGTTFAGLHAVTNGRIIAHRRWMLRSYAMAAAAITLRLMIPAAFIAGIDFALAYPAIAWLCWIVNLAIVEAYLRFVPDPTPQPVVQAAT